MRPLILTVLIALASPAPVAAFAMLPMPPSDYPDQGTFCGALTPCPQPAPVQPER